MKIISLILALFLISLIAHAYGQSLSELDQQLDEMNRQKATEIESSQAQQQSSFAKVDCPQGTHERAISGGSVVCVDDVTGKQVNPVPTLHPSSLRGNRIQNQKNQYHTALSRQILNTDQTFSPLPLCLIQIQWKGLLN